MRGSVYLDPAICAILSLGSIYSSTGSAVEDTSREFKQTFSELTELRDSIQGFERISKNTGLGKQTTEAEIAIARARSAMEQGLWLTVIQETQRYLVITQQPNPQSWMKAQFMLGRAYEERGQASRAARAYLRYLSAFITAKKATYAELGEVLERLVRVSTKSGSRTKTELNQFLSAIAAMDVPDDMASELRYFTSIGGASIGQKSLALGWLNEDNNKNPTRPDQRARTLNFQALLAMQASKWQEAEAALQQIIAINDLTTSAKEGARLSLARVMLKLKRPKTALEMYESFSTQSSVYRDALFEKTFVYIRQNMGVQAKASAIDFLALYPEHPDALQMRSIRSWLDIHSGDLVAAKSSIESTTLQLEKIKSEVQKSLTAKDSLKFDEVKNILTITRGLVTAPVELEETLSMFEQFGDLNSRLDEVDGVVLNILYAISKSDLDQYRPEAANRRIQISEFVNKYMLLSEKLVQIEERRLDSTISRIDRQKLRTSRSSREQMFSQRATLSRDAKRLVSWVGPADQLANLAKTWARLQALERAEPFSAKESQQGPETLPIVANRVSRNLRNELLETLTEIRKEQVKNIVEQSRIQDLKMIYNEFAASIQADQMILTSYDPTQTEMLDILDDNDSQNSWLQISTTERLINHSLGSLESDSRFDLSSTLESINSLLNTRKELKSSLADLRDILERKAGSATSQILAHYDSVINQRIARQKKWAGDIDFLSYSDKSQRQAKEEEAHALELQFLADDLQNQDQGVVKTWQR